MKIGLIRCMQTEDICPATTCFKVSKGRKLASREYHRRYRNHWCHTTCGSCPGKRSVIRAKEIVK